jgi:hypothetical protein
MPASREQEPLATLAAKTNAIAGAIRSHLALL